MADLRRRVERLRARLDPSYKREHPSAVGRPAGYFREQIEECEKWIGKRALELRAARERGEELSDPFHQATGAELQARIVSYAKDGSFEEVPHELMVAFEDRVVGGIDSGATNIFGKYSAEEYRDLRIQLAARGLKVSLEHREEYERTA